MSFLLRELRLFLHPIQNKELPPPIVPTVCFPALSLLTVLGATIVFNWTPYIFFAVLVISPFWFLRAFLSFRRAKLPDDLFFHGMAAEYIQMTLPPILSGVLLTGAVSMNWLSTFTGWSETLVHFATLTGVYFLSHEAVLSRKHTILFSPAGMASGLVSAYLQFFLNLCVLFSLPILFGVAAYYTTYLYFGTNQIFSLFCAVVSAGVSYSIILKYFTILQSKVKRGQEAGTYEEAKAILDKIRQADDPGVFFGGVLLESAAATGHFLAVGTTGSGKTVTIKLLMESVLRLILRRPDHRAILFDAKRELYAYLHLKMGFPPSRIHVMNPFDQRGAGWAISEDIKTEAQAVELASNLNPPPEKEGDNAYFGKAARRITTGVTYSFILSSDEREARGEKRIDWTLRDLILALRYEESIRYLLNKHEDTRYLIKKYFRNEKTINEVLSTLDASISDFNVVAALWDHAPYKISLKDWACNPKGSIILLGWDKEHKKSLDPINRVIFQRLSDILINQTNSTTRRTWVFLDELRVISRGLPGLPGLTELLNMGREKNCCCCLGVIDLPGLISALGKESAEEITGLCDNVAALRTNSHQTAKWISEGFGNADIREQNLSRDSEGKHSIQEHVSERQVFLSGEFQGLKKPSKENDYTIGGYYLNAYTNPYPYDFRGVDGWHKIVPKLTEDEINRYGIIPRKPSEQKLRPWDQADLDRLEIDLDINILLEREVTLKRKPEQPITTPKFRLIENDEKEELERDIQGER